VSRIAVIGDIGGHLDQLREALLVLGADPGQAMLPEGLVVVQVGDLVHRGPDSAGAVRLVDAILRRHPDRWVQLMGNHEACHLGQPLFPHDELDPDTVTTLQRWDHQGVLRLGVALETADGPLLVTHAGLTHELWEQLERPATPGDAARRLHTSPHLARRPGRMLADTPGTGGVLWAEAGRELYLSWLRAEHRGVAAPFGQIHGHSSAYRWKTGRNDAPHELAARLRPDDRKRHVHLRLAGRPFTGIDPGFGRHADGRWSPLLLEGRLA
jgi:hypothetical protein